MRMNINSSFKKLEGKGERQKDSFQRKEGQKKCFSFKINDPRILNILKVYCPLSLFMTYF